jgi:folate-binding protein YgfZ
MDCLIPDISSLSTLENKSLLEKSRIEGGAFLLPPFSHLRLSGDDSLRYLNGQITADLRKLSSGNSLPACLLTPKGRLVAFLNIFKQEESFLIEMDCSLQEVVLERLERYLVTDNVSIEVVTPPKTIHIFGPLAQHPEIQNIPGTLISRIGFPGKDLVQKFHAELLEKPGSQMDSKIDSLFPSLPSGLLTTLLPADLVEVLRIEQKIPRWGFELTSETLPPEAGLEIKCIDYEKGCYLGQEVISRLKSIGHVNRLLHGFISKEIIFPGMEIFSKRDILHSIGIITSVALQNDSGYYVALGYLRRGAELASTLLAKDANSGAYKNIVMSSNLSSF